jgi:hypothetical protein
MATIFEAMHTFFTEDDWPVHQIGDDPAFSMTFQGENGQWVCIAQGVEELDRFIFYSVCPLDVPEGRRPAVAELLTRINYDLIIGNFEMSYETGDLRYKTSIDVEGDRLTPALVKQLVYSNVAAMDFYLPSIMTTIYGKMSPAEALAEIED